MSPGDEFNCLAIISFHVLAITLADGHHASGLSFTPDKFFYIASAAYQGDSPEYRRDACARATLRPRPIWQRLAPRTAILAAWRLVARCVPARRRGARGRAKQPFEFCRRPHARADASIACETAVGTPRAVQRTSKNSGCAHCPAHAHGGPAAPTRRAPRTLGFASSTDGAPPAWRGVRAECRRRARTRGVGGGPGRPLRLTKAHRSPALGTRAGGGSAGGAGSRASVARIGGGAISPSAQRHVRGYSLLACGRLFVCSLLIPR